MDSKDYRWDTDGYMKEFFARMAKEKKHKPFRKWLIGKSLITKGMRITSYTADYIIPLYETFKKSS